MGKLIYLEDDVAQALDELIVRAIDDFQYDAEYGYYEADDVAAFDAKVDKVATAIKASVGEIALSFGDGFEADSFVTLFGHLASGYIINVNDTDIVCTDIVCTDVYGDDAVGLYGYRYDPEQPDNLDPEAELGFDWDDIKALRIY